MIYLDNAATTQKKPECVIEAVTEAMRTLGNSSRGAHSSSLNAARTVFGARKRIQEFFGCDSVNGVVFTANSTEALNIAINGTISRGDHVISTDLEHNSVLRPLYRLQEELEVSLDFVPADQAGNVKYEDFEALIRPNTRAIVCTHASNLTGNMLDIARIGRIAKQHDLLFIVDASQTAGTIPIHMLEMNIDILCFTGHKGMFGPQGTGGLCVRSGISVRPWKVGGSGVQSYSRTQPAEMPAALEAGTLNGHGIAGLSAAVGFIMDTGISVIHEKEMRFMRQFYEQVKEIPGITVYGDFSGDRVPIVTLNFRDYDSGEVADVLSEDYGVAVRAGAHCAPRMHRALGTRDRGAVRFSFSWFNTEEEVAEVIQIMRGLCTFF